MMTVVYSGDIVQATIKGQQAAERLINRISTHHMRGDDLYALVSVYTNYIDPQADAFLRGFLRRIQKELER